jgi:hypothetical protein
MSGDPLGDRCTWPQARRVIARRSAIGSSVTCHRTLPSPAPEGFFHARVHAGRTPGSVDRTRSASAGTARGNKPPATAAATDSRTGTTKPVSTTVFASARTSASPTHCNCAALHELCWFDSSPMHQFAVTLVQAARTPECDSGGRGFDSRTSPQVPSPARFRDPRSSLAGGLPGRRGSRQIMRS